eukprot:m51a1_g14771 putative huntingtin family protein (2710) ;mRNA; f:384356-404104
MSEADHRALLASAAARLLLDAPAFDAAQALCCPPADAPEASGAPDAPPSRLPGPTAARRSRGPSRTHAPALHHRPMSGEGPGGALCGDDEQLLRRMLRAAPPPVPLPPQQLPRRGGAAAWWARAAAMAAAAGAAAAMNNAMDRAVDGVRMDFFRAHDVLRSPHVSSLADDQREAARAEKLEACRAIVDHVLSPALRAMPDHPKLLAVVAEALLQTQGDSDIGVWTVADEALNRLLRSNCASGIHAEHVAAAFARCMPGGPRKFGPRAQRSALAKFAAIVGRVRPERARRYASLFGETARAVAGAGDEGLAEALAASADGVFAAIAPQMKLEDADAVELALLPMLSGSSAPIRRSAAVAVATLCKHFPLPRNRQLVASLLEDPQFTRDPCATQGILYCVHNLVKLTSPKTKQRADDPMLAALVTVLPYIAACLQHEEQAVVGAALELLQQAFQDYGPGAALWELPECLSCASQILPLVRQHAYSPSSRVSTKAVAVAVLAQICRAAPDLFSAALLAAGDSLSALGAHLTDGDPLLRGATAALLGAAVSSLADAGLSERLARLADAASVVDVVVSCARDASAVTSRMACAALAACARSLAVAADARWKRAAYDAACALVATSGEAYWLVRIEVCDCLARLDYRALAFAEEALRGTPRMPRGHLQQQAVDFVLSQLASEDARVRHAAACALSAMARGLWLCSALDAEGGAAARDAAADAAGPACAGDDARLRANVAFVARCAAQRLSPGHPEQAVKGMYHALLCLAREYGGASPAPGAPAGPNMLCHLLDDVAPLALERLADSPIAVDLDLHIDIMNLLALLGREGKRFFEPHAMATLRHVMRVLSMHAVIAEGRGPLPAEFRVGNLGSFFSGIRSQSSSGMLGCFVNHQPSLDLFQRLYATYTSALTMAVGADKFAELLSTALRLLATTIACLGPKATQHLDEVADALAALMPRDPEGSIDCAAELFRCAFPPEAPPSRQPPIAQLDGDDAPLASWMLETETYRCVFLAAAYRGRVTGPLRRLCRNERAVRVFEPLVINAMAEYGISCNPRVQAAILRFLTALVKVNIKYGKLDKDGAFLRGVLEQCREREAFLSQPEVLLPAVVEFLSVLFVVKGHLQPSASPPSSPDAPAPPAAGAGGSGAEPSAMSLLEIAQLPSQPASSLSWDCVVQAFLPSIKYIFNEHIQATEQVSELRERLFAHFASIAPRDHTFFRVVALVLFKMRAIDPPTWSVQSAVVANALVPLLVGGALVVRTPAQVSSLCCLFLTLHAPSVPEDLWRSLVSPPPAAAAPARAQSLLLGLRLAWQMEHSEVLHAAASDGDSGDADDVACALLQRLVDETLAALLCEPAAFVAAMAARALCVLLDCNAELLATARLRHAGRLLESPLLARLLASHASDPRGVAAACALLARLCRASEGPELPRAAAEALHAALCARLELSSASLPSAAATHVLLSAYASLVVDCDAAPAAAATPRLLLQLLCPPLVPVSAEHRRQEARQQQRSRRASASLAHACADVLLREDRNHAAAAGVCELLASPAGCALSYSAARCAVRLLACVRPTVALVRFAVRCLVPCAAYSIRVATETWLAGALSPAAGFLSPEADRAELEALYAEFLCSLEPPFMAFLGLADVVEPLPSAGDAGSGSGGLATVRHDDVLAHVASRFRRGCVRPLSDLSLLLRAGAERFAEALDAGCLRPEALAAFLADPASAPVRPLIVAHVRREALACAARPHDVSVVEPPPLWSRRVALCTAVVAAARATGALALPLPDAAALCTRCLRQLLSQWSASRASPYAAVPLFDLASAVLYEWRAPADAPPLPSQAPAELAELVAAACDAYRAVVQATQLQAAATLGCAQDDVGAAPSGGSPLVPLLAVLFAPQPQERPRLGAVVAESACSLALTAARRFPGVVYPLPQPRDDAGGGPCGLAGSSPLFATVLSRLADSPEAVLRLEAYLFVTAGVEGAEQFAQVYASLRAVLTAPDADGSLGISDELRVLALRTMVAAAVRAALGDVRRESALRRVPPPAPQYRYSHAAREYTAARKKMSRRLGPLHVLVEAALDRIQQRSAVPECSGACATAANACGSSGSGAAAQQQTATAAAAIDVDAVAAAAEEETWAALVWPDVSRQDLGGRARGYGFNQVPLSVLRRASGDALPPSALCGGLDVAALVSELVGLVVERLPPGARPDAAQGAQQPTQEQQQQQQAPASVLEAEAVYALVALSDLLGREQHERMLPALLRVAAQMVELQRPADPVLASNVVLALLKFMAVATPVDLASPGGPRTKQVADIVRWALEPGQHPSVQLAALAGMRYVAETHAPAPLLEPVLMKFVLAELPSSAARGERMQLALLEAAFSIACDAKRSGPGPNGGGSSSSSATAADAQLLAFTRRALGAVLELAMQRDCSVAVARAVFAGLGRMMASGALTAEQCRAVEELALRRLQSPTHACNSTRSFLALGLLINCMYASDERRARDREVLAHTPGMQDQLMADDMDNVERVKALFSNIRKGMFANQAPSLLTVVARLLVDLFNADQVLSLVMSEMAKSKEDNREYIAYVLYKVVQRLGPGARLVCEWVAICAANFLQQPRDFAVWSLTVVFLAASPSPLLNSMFPDVAFEKTVDDETFLLAAAEFATCKELDVVSRHRLSANFTYSRDPLFSRVASLFMPAVAMPPSPPSSLPPSPPHEPPPPQQQEEQLLGSPSGSSSR